jgi:hypothetical protein
MTTCSRVRAAAEAKVKGLLGTKIYTSRLGFSLHPLLITVMSHMFLQWKAIELSSSLFPKLYKSGKFRVRIAKNNSQFKQPLKSSLSAREIPGLNFIFEQKVQADDRVTLLAHRTDGNAGVRKSSKSNNQVCPAVGP